MLKVLGSAALLCAAASVSFAAGIPAHSVTGNYIEARTADVYTGPCFANGEAEINGKEAVFGWKINQGKWDGVDVAGLSVVGVVRTEHTLGNPYVSENPGRAVLIVDERATPEQSAALQSFAKHMAGELLKTIVRVETAPIQLEVADNNIHAGKARLTAGSLAAIQTRGLSEHDHLCGNEDVYYPPLTALEHAMPAFTEEDSFQGQGLGETWRNGPRRSAFLGNFRVASE